MPDSGDYVGARPYLERAFTAGHASGRDRNTAAGFLDEDWPSEVAGQPANGVEDSTEVAIAVWLDEFLSRIQVHAERIGRDAVEKRAHLGD